MEARGPLRRLLTENMETLNGKKNKGEKLPRCGIDCSSSGLKNGDDESQGHESAPGANQMSLKSYLGARYVWAL